MEINDGMLKQGNLNRCDIVSYNSDENENTQHRNCCCTPFRIGIARNPNVQRRVLYRFSTG